MSNNQATESGVDPGVCVIGAGLSGLAVANALQQRRISFVFLERSSGVGGLWRQPGAGERGPGYRSLHINTSKLLTGYADFPMPTNFPPYPRHDQVAGYLRSFAEHTNLIGCVELFTEVVSIRPQHDKMWEVNTRDTRDNSMRTRTFRHVVVASGHHSEPAEPSPPVPGADTFLGVQLHSSDYLEGSSFAAKKVLVVGFGASAVDISVELSRMAERTLLSVRRGLHLVPKQMFGMAIDEIAATAWWSRMSLTQQRRLIELVLRLSRGKLSDYGLPEPDHPLFSSALTISDELLSRINHGAVTPKPAVESIDGSTVCFADGSADHVDAIIYCTGYRLKFAFLPDSCLFVKSGQLGLYQRVVAPDFPGLYFAGLIRPVGSITRLVEWQAQWIADLVDGSGQLPPTRAMHDEITSYLDAVTERYGPEPGHSIQVDFTPYIRALGRERSGTAADQRSNWSVNSH